MLDARRRSIGSVSCTPCGTSCSSSACVVSLDRRLGAIRRGRARATSGSLPGVLAPGPLNAITDVAGVRVGHTTLDHRRHVRTGVTVVVPHAGNVFQDKVPGAVFVGNAFGKLAGSTQVDELGTIETPIALTNTLRVGAAVEGLVRWTLQQPGNEQCVRSTRWSAKPTTAASTTFAGCTCGPSTWSRRWPRRARAGRGGQRRRGHRHPRVLVERRNRDRVAPPRRAAPAATPSACSSRATTAVS